MEYLLFYIKYSFRGAVDPPGGGVYTRAMGLRWRIALPFAALVSALFGVVAVVAAAQVSGAVERRLTAQAENLAGLLARSPGLAASPALPGYIREAYGAEAGIEIAGALAPEHLTVPAWRNELEASLRGGSLRRVPGELQPFLWNETVPRLVAYAPIGRDRGLLLLYDPEIVEAEKTRARGPVLTVAGVGLLLVVVVAYLIARTIASPVERLAETARLLSEGTLEAEVPAAGGGSEIGRLEDAFRNMIEGLRRNREQLLKSERLAVLGQMAAGVAHEIRNPLSAMKMTVQMLRQETPESAREPHDVLLREIERLELTVSELFNAVHPSKLQKTRLPLPALAEEVLALLRPQLEHLSIRVERRFESGNGVDVDPQIFKRAIMNLVLNGAQAMPSGGPLIIGTAVRDGRVRFFVRDAGPGVAPEVRDRVFEPFVSTKVAGTGLGLAVTRKIVEDHGGSIGFDSTTSGAEFWIELPRTS